MEVIRAAGRHAGRIAARAAGRAISYRDLLGSSERIAAQIAPQLPARSPGAPNGPRIGVYAEPGFGYVASTWAVWMAGGVAVPLAVSHPPAEIDYVIRDAGVSVVLAPEASAGKLADTVHQAGASLHALDPSLFDAARPDGPGVAAAAAAGAGGDDGGDERRASHAAAGTAGPAGGGGGESGGGALIIYTSGTTGRPKGALHTHGSLWAQVGCLVDAWGWRASDRILHALPLHHIHGIVNAMHCAHAAGACVDFMASFQPNAAWRRLRDDDISVLMAVPTMYTYLVMAYDKAPPDERARLRAAAAGLRLAVSGSAAAPVALLQRWREISGQTLLERYGMTETGMILSNPYAGERRAGFVGLPLPGVRVKVAADADAPRGADPDHRVRHTPPAAVVAPCLSATSDLRVGGPFLFKEYWGRPEATADAFDEDGMFKTGDVVALEGQPPYFKIMGRASVDIIKSNAFKVSALEVEGALLQHPALQECAVVGVPDALHGEAITALVVPKEGAAGDLGPDAAATLRAFCTDKLPKYKVPSAWRLLQKPLPRNAMGKINKKDLLKRLDELV